MPYEQGSRLSGESASRLGHLDVLNSPMVKQLCTSYESTGALVPIADTNWEQIPNGSEPLPLIFGVDGSLQTIDSEQPPYKRLAFVKTAILKMDQVALAKLDKESPNPFAIRDIMEAAPLYHATVFPLRNVTIPGLSLYDTVRRIIFESMQDASLNAMPFQTLKWIAYEKWDGEEKALTPFGCPHCDKNEATLPYNAETGNCPNCNGELYLTDMLGFHLGMGLDSAPDSIATDYMAVHETLMLFTGIRHFWESNPAILDRCLFVKDGPLSIRAQYSKLVNPIRRFLKHAVEKDCNIHILGQEKTGYFCDHLDIISINSDENSYFIPGDHYIKANIQNRQATGASYGRDTNYGAKIFVTFGTTHQMVLSIPTKGFIQNPTFKDLIGADRILATLPTILSSRFENALLPIELAHGVASLSTYPSAQILKVFADSAIS